MDGKMPAPDEALDDLALVAVGVEPVTPELEARLTADAGLRAALSEMRDGVVAMASSTDPVRPSAALRDRLKESLLAHPRRLEPARAAAAPAPIGRGEGHRLVVVRRGSWARYAFAAAAVVVMGLAIWTVNLASQLGEVQQELAASQGAIGALANADRVVAVTSSTGQAVAGAYAVSGDGGTLIMRDMPAPPAGREYQLWFISDGTPKPSVVFKPSRNGSIAIPIGAAPGDFTGIAITAEPAGGSQVPTLPVLAYGASTQS